jgi:hypothetical protein
MRLSSCCPDQFTPSRISSDEVLPAFSRKTADKDDPRIPMTAAEFLGKAWKVAYTKARELGWIS